MKCLYIKDVRFKHTIFFKPYSSLLQTKTQWKKDKTTKNERNDKEKESIQKSERNKKKIKQMGDMHALSNSCGMFTLLLPYDFQLANCNFGMTTSKTTTKQVSFMCLPLLIHHKTITVTHILAKDLLSMISRKKCFC